MGKVVWFTGLSGSGKTTIALRLKKELEKQDKTVHILDGDVVRNELHKDLGFSREDIRENNRLIALLAKKYQDSSDFVLVPIISPYREDRAMARSIIGPSFMELYVNCSLDGCIKRDVKGLYQKALAGEIDNLIGVADSNPYEAPENPELEINTEKNDLDTSIDLISSRLLKDKLPFETSFPEIKMAIEGILEAGKAVMEIYSRDYDISRDKDGEPTTEADKKSNQILMNALGKTGHMILSEEDVNDEKRLGEEYVWIVDPIDGTSDFVNKTGEFTIMVGLVKDHVPVLGLVLWPPQKILFIGEKGKGAYKLEKGEWQKIRCSSKTDLKECRLMRSRHHLSEEEQRVASELGITMAAARGSSLKAMDIAQGSGDLYFTLTSKIKQWDTCASYCILTEAGGKMTDIFGNALQYNTTKVNHENGILATNGIVHENFIKNCQRH